jgi:hypothetical protein
MRAWLDECRRVAVSVSSRLGNTEILLLMLLSLWAPTMQSGNDDCGFEYWVKCFAFQLIRDEEPRV